MLLGGTDSIGIPSRDYLETPAIGVPVYIIPDACQPKTLIKRR